MIQIGGYVNPCNNSNTNTNNNNDKVAGGLEGAATPALMMFVEVMIRIGVQLNLCKKSKKKWEGGGGGGGGSPPMKFEELMIQLGVQLVKSL